MLYRLLWDAALDPDEVIRPIDTHHELAAIVQYAREEGGIAIGRSTALGEGDALGNVGGIHAALPDLGEDGRDLGRRLRGVEQADGEREADDGFHAEERHRLGHARHLATQGEERRVDQLEHLGGKCRVGGDDIGDNVQ